MEWVGVGLSSADGEPVVMLSIACKTAALDAAAGTRGSVVAEMVSHVCFCWHVYSVYKVGLRVKGFMSDMKTGCMKRQ